MQHFFSDAALEKLSSPEKLDQMVTIVGTKAWITLIIFAIAISAIMSWGFFGTIKTKIKGEGMLLGGAVHDIVPISYGQIIKVLISPGDSVKKGQIIAEIVKPNLDQQINETKAKLKELQIANNELNKFGNQDILIQEDYLTQQKATLVQIIKTNHNSIDFLLNQIKVEKTLFDKGLITQLQLINSKQKLDQAKDVLQSNKTKLKSLGSQRLNTEYNLEQRILQSKQQINEVIRSIEQLKETKDLYTKIRSPYDGHILELLVDRGAVVNIGQSIAKLGMTNIDNKIHAVIFLQTEDGKKVNLDEKDHIDVLVSPLTIKPEEHGYIKGYVKYVSEYPSSRPGLMRILKNEIMVDKLTTNGAPFEMHVELERNPKNKKNGFLWSSGDGPKMNIYAGTPCFAWTTIMEQRPITLAIPAFKKFFKIY